MKKLNILFAMFVAMIALSFSAKAEDYTLTLNIDNPTAVTVNINYKPVTMNPGANEVACTDNTTITVAEKDGYKITSFNDKDGNAISGYSGTYSIYANAANYAGQSYTITTDEIIFDGEVIVNVDKAQGLYLYMDGKSSPITLEDGDNMIPYCSKYHKELKLSDYSNNIYSVKVNGKPASWSAKDYYWHMPLPAGRIDIRVNYPDVDCKVKLTFTNPGTEGFLTSVKTGPNNDQKDIARDVFLSDNFVVKAGTDVTLGSVVKDNYTFTSMTLGDRVITSFWGTQTFRIKGDCEIVIDVTKLETKSATINIAGDASAVRATLNYNALPLVAGANVIEFVDGKNGLNISSTTNNYTILVSRNGNEEKLGQNIMLADGDVINIEMTEKIFDKHFVIFADKEPSSFRMFNFTTAGGATVPVKLGYQTLGFAEGDSPFWLQEWPHLYSYEWVYLNNEPVVKNGMWKFDIQDGDVLKFFWASGNTAPEKYSVAFSGSTDVCTVKYDLCKDLTDFTAATEHLVGTQFDITPLKPMTLTVNSVAVEPVDGKYTFTVSEETEVEIIADNSNSVDMLTVGSKQTVYNVHGIKVADDITAAPAGLYIVGGKKVIKK